MSVKYICDGCGKEEKADTDSTGRSRSPYRWLVRRDTDGELHACSKECVLKATEKTGKPAFTSCWI